MTRFSGKRWLRTLVFLLLFLAAAGFTDCSPSLFWARRGHLTDIVSAMFPPDWSYTLRVLPPLLATVQMSVTGTALGAGLALLLGMGVDAVSASPRFVPGMKHMLRRLNAATCMDLAYNVLMSADISASQRMVRERLQESLGSELAFHTTSILTHSHE